MIGNHKPDIETDGIAVYIGIKEHELQQVQRALETLDRLGIRGILREIKHEKS